MGTPVSYCVRCCHDHPHLTGEKTEALRSQNPALADHKNGSTPPPPRSLPLTSQPQPHGPWKPVDPTPDQVLPLGVFCPQVELHSLCPFAC